MSPRTLPASALLGIHSSLKAASFLLVGIAVAVIITGCIPTEPKENDVGKQTSSATKVSSPIEAQIFRDVPMSHVNVAAIQFVASGAYMRGTNGEFNPEKHLSRAEFAAFLAKTDIPTHALKLLTFSDVSPEAWYAPAIQTAISQGCVLGYEDGTFRPAAPVSFAEAAKVASYVFDPDFSDRFCEGKDEGALWFRTYVYRLSNAHAIPLSIQSLTQPVTRAEFAEMVYRMHKATYHNAIVRTQTQWPSRTYESLVDVRSQISDFFPDHTPHYFIVYSTLKDREAAKRKATEVNGWGGESVWVLPTDLTTNFTHGYYAVVGGPFQKKPYTGTDGSYLKDAGDLLWPSSLPFDARKFPPGILQALAGEVGIDNISSSGSFVGWSSDAEASLCGDLGRGFLFTFRTKTPFTHYSFSQEQDENMRKMFGGEDETLQEWHKRVGSPTQINQHAVFWALETTGEVRRGGNRLCFD